jgi:hypothetical protein
VQGGQRVGRFDEGGGAAARGAGSGVSASGGAPAWWLNE